MTSGSLSVQDSGLAIRQASAHAAQLFKTCACVSYAELRSHVDVKLPVDVTVPTKSTALTLTEGRDDIEALVQGQPIFLHDLGINVDLTPIKNLLYGRMVRGPGLRCTLRTEGWADAVAFSAASRLPGINQVFELLRRRQAVGAAQKTFATLLGLELRPRLQREAMAMWQQVGAEVGTVVRDSIWKHPDLLPSAEDIQDPSALIKRLSGGDDDFDSELNKLLGN
jgi:hypothetical protein